MACHIIFDNDGKYKGYCENNEWLKLFIKQRKHKYTTRKIHKNELNPALKNKIFQDWDKLTVLKLSDEPVVMTCYEGVEFSKYIDDNTDILRYNIDTILNILQNIKLSTIEKKIIEECLSIIDINIDIYNEMGDDGDILDKLKLFKEFIGE